MRPIDYAFLYLEKGLGVIPIYEPVNGKCSCGNSECRAPGKHPRIKEWQKNFATTREQIIDWFERWPNTNIAIVTGKYPTVIDYDFQNGGEDSYEKIKGLIGESNTPTVVTGRGFHQYFCNEGDPLGSKIGLLPGVDIKSDGGYVVAPPSRHFLGTAYEWKTDKTIFNMNPADFPLSVLSLKTKQNSQPKNELVPEGGRNAALFQLACSLRAKGHEQEEILAKIMKFRDEQCDSGKHNISDSELVGIAERASKYEKGAPLQNHPFVVHEGKISHSIFDHRDEEIKNIPLCNFTARIESELTYDSGFDQKVIFKIEGHTADGEVLPVALVPADKFSALSWIPTSWGSRAIINPGFQTRDLLRAAIQYLSNETKSVTVFTHTGWVSFQNQFYFLSSSGALGADGINNGILFDPSEGNLSDFNLPEPPTGVELIKALEISLSILELGPPHIVIPGYCVLMRAPLQEVQPTDFTGFVIGPTGSLKSSFAGVLQSHFGRTFSYDNLPDSWLSTANYLEKKFALAKDVLLVVDDWVPGEMSPYVVQRSIRSLGNRQARARLRSDTSSRPAFIPRCQPLTTAEDIVGGHSLRARMAIIEVNKGDIDSDLLKNIQKAGRQGVLAQAMAGYISWLAPRIPILKENVHERMDLLKDQFSRSEFHRKTATTLSQLAFGLECFIEYAVSVQAITQERGYEIIEEAKGALLKNAELQAEVNLAEEPSIRFVECLALAFLQGKAHLCNAHDIKMLPKDHEKWGWKDNKNGDLYASGDLVGWHASSQIFLHPEAAYLSALRVSQQQGKPIQISKEAMWRSLAQAGIIQISEGEGKNLIKRSVAGQARKRLLIIPDPTIFMVNAPLAPEAPEMRVKKREAALAEAMKEDLDFH